MIVEDRRVPKDGRDSFSLNVGTICGNTRHGDSHHVEFESNLCSADPSIAL